MSRIQVTWVVKTKKGQVKGPYSTQAILRMIGEGVFSGQEMISKIPDGKWELISKEPAFYDKLLEALEGVVEVDPKKVQKMEADTLLIPATPTKDTQAKNNLLKPQEDKTAPNTRWGETASAGDKSKIEVFAPPKNLKSATHTQSIQSVTVNKTSNKTSIVDLSDVKNFQTSDFKKNLKAPGIALIVVALLAVLFLWDSGSGDGNKIHLLAPGKSSNSMGEAAVKSNLSEALKAIEQDTFDSYRAAENKLVNIIEGSSTNLEVRALLCLVYKELWPYAMQDAQDIKTVAMLTQSTRALNVVSPYGHVCEAVKLITAGRYNEAKGVVEAVLGNNEPFSLVPVLYDFKAELLAGDKDYLNAAAYYEKAAQLWDRWLNPQVELAKIYSVKDEHTSAGALLKKALQANPQHREAKVLMGILEFRGFRKSDTAYEYLNSGLNSSGRIPSLVESDAYTVLAEVLSLRGEKSRAREAAEKAYKLNPNNSEVRKLVLRLGGSDKVKDGSGQNSELLYLGDQYVRQGDYLAAQAEFKAAFEADPKNGTAAMKAAKALWQLNQSFEAIDWLEKAIKAEPKLISAYVQQADYLSQRFDFLGALQTLTKATRISPNNYEVLRGLATLEYRKNNMRGTLTFAMKALKAYDGDIETYILLSSANSILARSIIPSNKNEIERKENAIKDSIRFATKAVEIDSTNPEAQITYAKMLAQNNGVDSGILYLNELIKRFSYTLEYRVALAELYKSEERYSQARDIYNHVVEADPKNKKAWLGLGESNRALGLNEKSLKDFLSAAILDPTDGEALFQTGKLYLELGRFDEAIQQFKRVQRLNPHYPRTHYYIGKAAFSAGDFATALDSAKAEKKQNPNVADSYILAAEVFTARKQYAECAGEYSQAMKLRPQGADIYVKSATCYRQSGSLDVAEDMLALASARESGYAEIYREQGAIYELRGDSRAAATAYVKYLGLSPNALDRAQVETKIRSLGF